MGGFRYVWIDKKRYMIYSHKGISWRLFDFADGQKLKLSGAYSLDFWRRKGVLNGEEEKKDNGS